MLFFFIAVALAAVYNFTTLFIIQQENVCNYYLPMDFNLYNRLFVRMCAIVSVWNNFALTVLLLLLFESVTGTHTHTVSQTRSAQFTFFCFFLFTRKNTRVFSLYTDNRLYNKNRKKNCEIETEKWGKSMHTFLFCTICVPNRTDIV